mgnify:FL=1|tara:strand:+ start:6733 stop:7419 length:687 start_codon:yes stop_codon:yes gene_type:complete
MESQVQKLYGDSYKQWLKEHYPKSYENKYGVTKLDGKFKKLVKGSALAGLVYELGKEVLKIEKTGDSGETMIPYNIEGREKIRRQVINANIPKITFDEKGVSTYTAGANVNLKDYLPYKKKIFDPNRIPDAPVQGEESKETLGVDYEWVDPLDDQYGSITHYDDADKYILTEFGYVEKSKVPMGKRVISQMVDDIKTVKSFIPPEIRGQVKNVADVITYTATGGRYPK